jgi:hypothetical protein
MDMDEERDVAAAVRQDGEQISKEARDALRDRFESAANGEISVIAERAGSRRTRWRVMAAASVVVIGGVTTLVYLESHRQAAPTSIPTPTSDAAPTVATTALARTTLPATTVPTSTSNAPSTMPTSSTIASPPLGELPYASVDAKLPMLVAGATVKVGPADEAPAWSAPWPDLPFGSDAQPAPQGWLAAYRSGTAGRWTVRFFDETGTTMRWQIRVVDSKADGSKWDNRVLAGPTNVVYVRYFSERDGSVDAIATAGPRAGSVVASWPLPAPLGECGFPCQDNTPPTALLTEGDTTIPFVDEKGAPVTTTNPFFGVSFDYQYGPGPAMPASWITHTNESQFDDLASVRVTMTRHHTTWTFDALGVQTYAGGMEGFPFFSYQATQDGGYALTFRVGDHPNPNAGQHETIIALLHADGTVSLYQLDPSLASAGDVTADATGNLILGTNRAPTTGTSSTWVRLLPRA